MYHGDHFWGMHFWGWIVWLVIIVFIIVYVLDRFAANKNQPKHETPLDVLKKKYASGEISTEEYEERKKILERDQS